MKYGVPPKDSKKKDKDMPKKDMMDGMPPSHAHMTPAEHKKAMAKMGKKK